MQSEHGKPRPALVLQADRFAMLETVTVLPLVSTHPVRAITRIDVAPSKRSSWRRAN
jgi:mRNA interferase MazF